MPYLIASIRTPTSQVWFLASLADIASKVCQGLASPKGDARFVRLTIVGRHRARCLTVRLPMVAIGRALQPFPRSKRSRHVSAHSAFQLGLSTLEGRIRRCRRRGAPASEDCHLPSSLPPLASLLTGLP